MYKDHVETPVEITKITTGVYELTIFGSGRETVDYLIDRLVEIHKETHAEMPDGALRMLIQMQSLREMPMRDMIRRAREDGPEAVLKTRYAIMTRNATTWDFAIRTLKGLNLLKSEIGFFSLDEREKALEWLMRD